MFSDQLFRSYASNLRKILLVLVSAIMPAVILPAYALSPTPELARVTKISHTAHLNKVKKNNGADSWRIDDAVITLYPSIHEFQLVWNYEYTLKLPTVLINPHNITNVKLVTNFTNNQPFIFLQTKLDETYIFSVTGVLWYEGLLPADIYKKMYLFEIIPESVSSRPVAFWPKVQPINYMLLMLPGEGIIPGLNDNQPFHMPTANPSGQDILASQVYADGQNAILSYPVEDGSEKGLCLNEFIGVSGLSHAELPRGVKLNDIHQYKVIDGLAFIITNEDKVYAYTSPEQNYSIPLGGSEKDRVSSFAPYLVPGIKSLNEIESVQNFGINGALIKTSEGYFIPGLSNHIFKHLPKNINPVSGQTQISNLYVSESGEGLMVIGNNAYLVNKNGQFKEMALPVGEMGLLISGLIATQNSDINGFAVKFRNQDSKLYLYNAQGDFSHVITVPESILKQIQSYKINAQGQYLFSLGNMEFWSPSLTSPEQPLSLATCSAGANFKDDPEACKCSNYIYTVCSYVEKSPFFVVNDAGVPNVLFNFPGYQDNVSFPSNTQGSLLTDVSIPDMSAVKNIIYFNQKNQKISDEKNMSHAASAILIYSDGFIPTRGYILGGKVSLPTGQHYSEITSLKLISNDEGITGFKISFQDGSRYQYSYQSGRYKAL